MSNSNNKGKTWAANVRRLNKKGWNEPLVREVEGMSNDQWEAEVIRLGQALEVLREKAPNAFQKAEQLNDKFCEEGGDAPGAVFLARGVVLLAALLKDRGQADEPEARSTVSSTTSIDADAEVLS
jgi:hypothetical protein